MVKVVWSAWMQLLLGICSLAIHRGVGCVARVCCTLGPNAPQHLPQTTRHTLNKVTPCFCGWPGAQMPKPSESCGIATRAPSTAAGGGATAMAGFSGARVSISTASMATATACAQASPAGANAVGANSFAALLLGGIAASEHEEAGRRQPNQTTSAPQVCV